jgi:carbon monoxide dehydrogenase subunit G
MRLAGKVDAKVPQERFWTFLLNLDEFAACVPGLESIAQVDDSTFDGVVGAKVGPIAGKFTFRARITERHEPHRMVVAVDGAESVTGGKMGATINLALADTGERRTSLSYQADVALSGKLAIVGEMVIRVTAGVLLDEFADRMRRRLEATS